MTETDATAPGPGPEPTAPPPAMQQTPSIGRIVHWWDHMGPEGGPGRAHPAIITRVWSDTSVNLTVFRDGSVPIPASSQQLGRHWTWPPYVRPRAFAAQPEASASDAPSPTAYQGD